MFGGRGKACGRGGMNSGGYTSLPPEIQGLPRKHFLEIMNKRAFLVHFRVIFLPWVYLIIFPQKICTGKFILQVDLLTPCCHGIVSHSHIGWAY
jgi:hypothetical protein